MTDKRLQRYLKAEAMGSLYKEDLDSSLTIRQQMDNYQKIYAKEWRKDTRNCRPAVKRWLYMCYRKNILSKRAQAIISKIP